MKNFSFLIIYVTRSIIFSFSWIIEIIGFKKESYGNFAICKRTDNNKVEIVNYAVEVLNEDYGYESI